MRFTDVYLEFLFTRGPMAGDHADVLVTVVRRCGCDTVQWIDFDGRHMPDMTGEERAEILAWIETSSEEFDEMIADARERQREEAA